MSHTPLLGVSACDDPYAHDCFWNESLMNDVHGTHGPAGDYQSEMGCATCLALAHLKQRRNACLRTQRDAQAVTCCSNHGSWLAEAVHGGAMDLSMQQQDPDCLVSLNLAVLHQGEQQTHQGLPPLLTNLPVQSPLSSPKVAQMMLLAVALSLDDASEDLWARDWDHHDSHIQGNLVDWMPHS